MLHATRELCPAPTVATGGFYIGPGLKADLGAACLTHADLGSPQYGQDRNRENREGG
jgi:hypothetical protein